MKAKKVLALILAGGEGERLSILSEKRAKPAVPFAGKFRIIDFALSNCVNSDIYNVAVLTQYRPRSLNDHIGIGIPWDLNRAKAGVRLLQPYLGRRDEDWYRGTADAVYQNVHFIRDQDVDLVLILAGDPIYKMDYTWMIAEHEDKGADVTVGVLRVPISEASKFGVLAVDEQKRIIEFEEKPAHPKSDLVSMGIYVFEKNILMERLREDARTPGSHRDFGRDIIPMMLRRGDSVYAYRFDGYWRDVGTIQSYWEATMSLLEDVPELNLYDEHWRIHTRSEERAPAKIGESAVISRSMISHGCIINGRVEHSVLSPGVRVEEGAVVRDSIIMPDTIIGMNATLDKCILDKEIVVGPNCKLGYGDDYTPNRNEPGKLNSGITIIGKHTRLPSGLVVGRNCKISTDLTEEDFPENIIPSGETIEAAQPFLFPV